MTQDAIKVIEQLVEALENIVSTHNGHCEHHVGVSKHSYNLAAIAEEALTAGQQYLQAHVPETDFGNIKVQAVYELLCNPNEQPPEGEHWEGYMARRIVDTLQAQVNQEPDGWQQIEIPYPQGDELDICMADGSIFCNVLPQMDGDLWWGGAGTGEKFIDPKYSSVTHWRIHTEPAAKGTV